MSIWGDLAAGGVKGLADGIGGMAKSIREAVTGKSVLTGEEVIKLQTIAQQMEIAALEADKAVMQGQVEINKIEAQSGSAYRGGWRPFIGWIGAVGLGYQYIIRPMLPWTLNAFGVQVPEMPEMGMESLMPLILGMLGLGGFRTFEKVKGASK